MSGWGILHMNSLSDSFTRVMNISFHDLEMFRVRELIVQDQCANRLTRYIH